LNIPIKFNGASINPLIGAPVLGQDTETKLLEIGFSWEDISKFKDQGAII
jgi:crotonobetainyl-CoA:carnitine CoA-transferase CaiB-like acyl-CoA transferase